jgi:hypothetical protein
MHSLLPWTSWRLSVEVVLAALAVGAITTSLVAIKGTVGFAVLLATSLDLVPVVKTTSAC